MTGSSSTEDDGAVVAPSTLWTAMAQEKEEGMDQKALFFDIIDRLSAQSATLRAAREIQCMSILTIQNE